MIISRIFRSSLSVVSPDTKGFSHSDSENSRFLWCLFGQKQHAIPFRPFSQIPRTWPLCKHHRSEHREGCSGSTPEAFHVYSLQQLRQILRFQMSIALQHLQCLVASNGRHLHRVETFLEEPARGFVTEIVKGEIDEEDRIRT